MAVAFDAVAIPALALYTATFSWTHTPVGTPKGVAVIVVQEGSTDQVSGVTYGGSALTRVRSDVRTTTEAGRVYIYFLGSGIPTGAQTVQVTLTGTADTNAVSLTVTATADTAVDVSDGLDAGIIANPSLAISPTVAAVIFYGIFTGLAAPVTTVQTGSTHIAGKDYGADSAMWARKSVSAGATTIGYTAALDDVCHSALAIKELVAQTFYQTLTGIAIGVGVISKASSFYRVLPAIAIGVASLSTVKAFSQAINAVAQGVASLSRTVTYSQVLSATALGVITLTKATTHYITLAAIAVGIPKLLKGMSKEISAVAVGIAELGTTLTARRTLEATATGQATITRVSTFFVNIGVVAHGVAGLATQFIAGSTTFYQTISAVAHGIANMVASFISGGALKRGWFSK